MVPYWHDTDTGNWPLSLHHDVSCAIPRMRSDGAPQSNIFKL